MGIGIGIAIDKIPSLSLLFGDNRSISTTIRTTTTISTDAYREMGT
jgi:hypothetical protein